MPEREYHSVFKSWVPRWLMFGAILLTIIPVAAGLGIYIGGISSAATYYGIDVIDVKYSIVIFYLAIASAFPLEKRFFQYFSSKPYLIGASVVFVVMNLILYNSHNTALFFIFRFVGGVLTLSFIGIIFTLIFQQFHSQRSRVLGYALLYGILFSTSPLCRLLDAFVFENHDFSAIFLLKIYSVIPGIVLMAICLKDNVKIGGRKIPLANVDWKSFILFASPLLLVGYILLYGQYYGWLNSTRIVAAIIVFVVLMSAFILRQLKLKRPYIDFRIYRYRNFVIGMLLLLAFYLSKGDKSVVNGFLASGVHLDVFHKSYVMLINAVGILLGAGITARYILAKMNMRLIWLAGFGCLLLYHVMMIALIGPQATASQLLIPMFLQGFGNGTLILSIVIFYVTAVPAKMAFSASVSGVSYRFFTFTASMALVSFFGLKQGSVHYNNFGDSVKVTNTQTIKRMALYNNALKAHGATGLQAKAGAKKLLGKAVKTQVNLLYARDYYLYMSFFIVFVMGCIVLIPHFHYRLQKIGAKLVPM